MTELHQNTVSDEEIELNSYLGEPAVRALCDQIGPDGRDIMSAAWRDGFASGAEAVENAIERSDFDALVLFTETSGAYKNDLVSARATLIDGQLYLSEGFNHNEKEAFATEMLGPDSVGALVTLAERHNRHGQHPIAKQAE